MLNQLHLEQSHLRRKKIQELVNTIIHSSAIQRIIDNLAKTAYNGHAAKAASDFAEIINDEHSKEESGNNLEEEEVDNKKRKSNFFFDEAKQQADEKKEEKIDKPELVEKRSQQKQCECVKTKTLAKFEVKSMVCSNIPNSSAMIKSLVMNTYKEVDDD